MAQGDICEELCHAAIQSTLDTRKSAINQFSCGPIHTDTQSFMISLTNSVSNSAWIMVSAWQSWALVRPATPESCARDKFGALECGICKDGAIQLGAT